MKKQIFLAAICCLMGVFFTSCEDDGPNDPLKSSAVTVLSIPEDMENATLTSATLVLKNVSTLEEETTIVTEGIVDNTISLTVTEGLYNVSVQGQVSLGDGDDVQQVTIRASKQNVQIVGESLILDLRSEAFIYQGEGEGGFVISEIFFTGTETPEGKQYNGDKYFKIYNNSSKVLYADGLAIAESELWTVGAYKNYREFATQTDDRNSKTPIKALYRIPGNGTQHPVQPGEFLLLVDNAIDHTKANSNSFDLTGADFEWYDVSSNPNYLDVDNDQVPNLDKVYCYTATIWGPHNRGFFSYMLVNLGTDAEFSTDDFLINNAYKYQYLFEWATGSMERTSSAYYVDNSKIVDAVNLSIESNFVELNIDKRLDQGWTYCGKVDSDKTRYGKCVRRKALSGKTLKDTNDSSVDFLPEQPADPNFAY